MSRIRVLIVDDSFIAREVLNEILSSDDELEVVGVACNGQEGVDMALKLTPDFITMDINMPVMNGLEAIDEIMSRVPTPILVISSVNDSKVAFDACAKGALDVFAKSDMDLDKADKLIEKIKFMAGADLVKALTETSIAGLPTIVRGYEGEATSFKKVIGIACSTGGPKALATILSQLPAVYPHPILIAQHIADGFLDGLVDWLDQFSLIPVRIGKSGTRIFGGRIYICPSEYHVKVNSNGILGKVARGPNDTFYPCCNILLTSLSEVFGDRGVGVILSGMADDGVAGIREIKLKGGFTIAQDEKTSVVFGMNARAIASGYVDRTLPLDEIGKLLSNLL